MGNSGEEAVVEKSDISRNFSPNALKVLEKRCLTKDEQMRVVETCEGLFRRVARTAASGDLIHGATEAEAEETERQFYDMMTSLEFMPNSPTLMNAGKRLGQLSACFVLPVGDSIEEIFDAVKYSAIIHKSGGGTGFSFSRLRPGGDVVGSTGGISSGPISFMAAFNQATETIKQGGARRGANMGLLRVDHPDIMNFIECKDDPKEFKNFNISVGITEEFMKALEANKEYDLINPRKNLVVGQFSARAVFSAIVNQAWKNGEPGVIFLDRMNAENPTPHIGAIETTNPCGEQPLLPFESCNLGSVNLAKMVTDSDVDWSKLRETVRKAVRFLDNIIDVNKYPLPVIDRMTKANRKIGLGVMGWADMLIQLRISYTSDEAVNLAESVMEFIHTEGNAASCDLALTRGVFPNYEGSIHERNNQRLRNATVTTIAPTGTLSLIANCSSGVEPLYAVSFVKTVLEGTKLVEVNPYFEAIARERGFWSRDIMEQIAVEGSIQGFDEIPDDIKKIFVTAHDITPLDHVRMQAAFQKHVDNAVSKTVNFRHEATVKDVEDAFVLAYKLGCKGVTVYRDGSRDEQVLTTGMAHVIEAGNEDDIYIEPMKLEPGRSKEAERVELPGEGEYELDVTIRNKRAREIWMRPPVEYGIAAELLELIARLSSIMLRSHIRFDIVLKQIRRAHMSYGNVSSPLANIERALLKIMGRTGIALPVFKSKTGEICPECGGIMQYEGGCDICSGCGFSKNCT